MVCLKYMVSCVLNLLYLNYSKGTQTEVSGDDGKLLILLSSTDGQTGSTQVTHPEQSNKVSIVSAFHLLLTIIVSFHIIE